MVRFVYFSFERRRKAGTAPQSSSSPSSTGSTGFGSCFGAGGGVGVVDSAGFGAGLSSFFREGRELKIFPRAGESVSSSSSRSRAIGARWVIRLTLLLLPSSGKPVAMTVTLSSFFFSLSSRIAPKITFACGSIDSVMTRAAS